MKNYTLNVSTTEQTTDIQRAKILRITVGPVDVQAIFQYTNLPLQAPDREEFRTLTAGKTYKFIAPRKKAFLAIVHKTASSTSTLTVEAGNDDIDLETSGATTITITPSALALDVSVTTVAAALSADTTTREEVTILADSANTDTVKVGGSGSALFPLVAGAGISLRKTTLSQIYAEAVSGTQSLHVIVGGS